MVGEVCSLTGKFWLVNTRMDYLTVKAFVLHLIQFGFFPMRRIAQSPTRTQFGLKSCLTSGSHDMTLLHCCPKILLKLNKIPLDLTTHSQTILMYVKCILISFLCRAHDLNSSCARLSYSRTRLNQFVRTAQLLPHTT